MELVELKVKLEPLTKIVSLLGKFNKKEDGGNSLLSNGMALGIDLLGGRYLSHTNWLARTLVPFVVKSIAKKFFVKKPIDDVL